MPDFFAKRFCCPALKEVAAVIIFVFLVLYSASVYKGLSGLFSMAFGISFVWCVIGIAVLTAVYVVVGGYMAAALNDLVQGIIMIAGIGMVVVSILNGKGGFLASLEQLSQIESPLAPTSTARSFPSLGLIRSACSVWFCSPAWEPGAFRR